MWDNPMFINILHSKQKDISALISIKTPRYYFLNFKDQWSNFIYQLSFIKANITNNGIKCYHMSPCVIH